MNQDHPQKTVYLVRHGQSEHNISPVYQGKDAPLSTAGLAQADKIAERASQLSFDALIASPLPRARQTAEAIARATGKQPDFSELFVEVDKPSRIEGMPFGDESADEAWRAWQRSLFEGGPVIEDAEDFKAQISRARQALAYLLDRPESTLVVVTHGFFLRTMVALISLGDSLDIKAFDNFRNVMFVENTSLTVIKYQPEKFLPPAWRLHIYNDHAHLAD